VVPADGLCLLSVHAHPDDESSKGASTVARYHAEGVRTILVCCTGGEAGDILDPAMDTPEVRADIGAVRLAELKAATDIIGYDDTVMLGYRDSGMPGTEANERPDSFAQAPLDEAVGRLVTVIRRDRPQVILTYPDEQTEYPHPDHLRVHEISIVATTGSPTPVRPLRRRSCTTRCGRPSASARSTPSSWSWGWNRPSARTGSAA
jgi:mycothiol S-conjugate amidase